MGRKSYKLRYHPNAAERLVSAVHHAILKRLNSPESYEPDISENERDYPYYRIYVKNM